MKNIDAVRSLCTAICNTFYPDDNAVNVVLFNEGIDANEESKAKDPAILKCAIMLVRGYVEGSSSQNGVSTSVRSQEAIDNSIRKYCYMFGVDPSEYGVDDVVICNVSHMW